MKYDIVIVGGGPAGSLAGINLIGSGLRVAILDRARFPRVKPCGGGISYRVFRRFPYLADTLRSVPTNVVSNVVFESPSGDAVHFASNHPLYAMIRRIEFDNALLDHCKRGGIDVKEDFTVTRVEPGKEGISVTSSTGENVSAEMVIGADGVNSVVAVHAGFRSSWTPLQIAIDGTEESPFTDLKSKKDTMYVYYGTGGGYGYGYVFPKEQHVNFGIGYLLDYYKRTATGTAYEQHLGFLRHLESTEVITGTSQRENFHAYVLPISGPLGTISRDRILLAGDAAGFVNGFTAEGIYYAMVTGEHAGKTARIAFQSRDWSRQFLQTYDQAVDGEIGEELRKSVSIQRRLFSNPALIDAIVRFASSSSSVRQLLTDYAVGEISYDTMKRRAIRTALPSYIKYSFDKLWHGLFRQ